jgi:membrane-associated phospholipid phosphatase
MVDPRRPNAARLKTFSYPTSGTDKRLPALAGIAGAGVLMALFAALAWAIFANDVVPLDKGFSLAVQSLRSPIFTRVMGFATYLASWQVVVGGTAALVIVLVAAGKRGLWIGTLLVAVIGDEIIVWTSKAIFRRTRPDQTLSLMPAFDPSFPSGHTFITMAFYGILAWFAIVALRQFWQKLAVGVAWALLALAVGISRIYLGAHWPTDVLGSYLLGGAWLVAVATIFSKLRPAPDAPGPPLTKTRGALAVVLLMLWVGLVVWMNVTHPGAMS